MGQPVQYTEGFVDFYGLRLATDQRALIPRFETEFLVKKTIGWCRSQKDQSDWLIADIGTGSGNIAIALARHLPKVKIMAVDISPRALQLAKENAIRYNVTDQITFIQGDLLSLLPHTPSIILANLPYLPTERLTRLDSSVRDFEPQEALDGGRDGFEIYRRLLEQIKNKSWHPQLAILEIDEGQEKIAAEEIAKHFPTAMIRILKDSSEFFRYAVVEF